MAINLMESFVWASASSANLTQEGWSDSIATSIVAGPRASARALEIGDGFTRSTTKSFTPSGSTGFFCARIKVASLVSGGFLQFLERGVATNVLIGMNGAGNLCAWRGSTSTLLGTSTEAITAGVWFQLTGKIVIDASNGSVEVRLNGSEVPVLNLSGINTKNGGTGVLNALALHSLTTKISFTDLAVWSDAGESPTGWVGDVRVDDYVPSAAGSSTQFTPSAGSNYECVDETAADGDTSYVQSATNGHVDLYAMANMAHTPSQIHAVGVTAVAKKTDAGSGSLKLKLKSGATAVESGTTVLSEGSYARLSRYWGADPNTSAAWSQSGVDALEAGIVAVI